MTKLPSISGKKLIVVLSDYGFRIIRQKGSHVFIRQLHSGRCTVIPIHANVDLGKGILRSILADIEIEENDFMAMLKKKKTTVEYVRLDRYSH